MPISLAVPKNNSAQLMRAIADELSQRIVPELTSADALERVGLARLTLHLAADIDVLAEVAEQLAPESRAAITAALSALPAEIFASEIGQWRIELEAIAPEHDLARQREIAALRTLTAKIVRQSADRIEGLPADLAAALEKTIASLGALDHRWLTSYEAARARKNAERPVSAIGAADAPAAIEVTPASVTRYLRRRYPASPQVEATAVIPIPGGRSKKTFLISVQGINALPTDFVMRQDYALRYEGTKVKDEYQPLVKLSDIGLSVPRPLLLEAEESELGPAFIFVARLGGAPPGSYFAMRTLCPGAFADLAAMLAKLHRADPAKLGFSAAGAPHDGLLSLIDTYQKKWRDNATKPSPLVDYAYAWARRECAKDAGSTAVIHGDIGPYNILVEADRLTAVLDWEFAQVGDPAVDLGIVRVYAEEVMSWDEFMGIYLAAGGLKVTERRIQLAMVVQFLKGTTLVAASGRNFEEGWTQEFIKGANSFTGMRMIELRIAGLLHRFGAV